MCCLTLKPNNFLGVVHTNNEERCETLTEKSLAEEIEDITIKVTGQYIVNYSSELTCIYFSGTKIKRRRNHRIKRYSGVPKRSQ